MRATEIIPGLWQSDWPNDTAWMVEHRIRTVVTPVPDSQGIGTYLRALPPYPEGVRIFRFPFLDTPGAVPPPGWLAAASAAVVEAMPRGPVLVHCAAGNNRSTGIVAASLMRLRGCTAAEAMASITAVRQVAPAPETLAALRDFEAERRRPDADSLPPAAPPVS